MTDAIPLVVARGADWEALDARPPRQDIAYGRSLTWRTNSEQLETLLAESLIARWKSLGIPRAAPDVSATAFVAPSRYMRHGEVPTPDEGMPQFTDIVHPDVGYQLVGPSGFGRCAWDRRTALACITDSADLPDMIEHLIQHVWSAAVMWHPPLYGIHAAAAIGPDGNATLLVGESHAGKSSLVAGLALRHGFRYLTDDLTLLDARSLRVYGRPWRLELRAGALREFWPDGPPPGRPVANKRVLDAREHVAVGTSALVGAVLFVRRGDRTALAPLAPDATRRHLGKAVSMFQHCPEVTHGYPEAFDALAQSSRGYTLTVDHDLGIAHTADVVADAVAISD
jgi:hypothetical protein